MKRYLLQMDHALFRMVAKESKKNGVTIADFIRSAIVKKLESDIGSTVC